MGKNKISQIMKSAAKDPDINMEFKKNKINTDRLMEAGVLRTMIVQLTSYKRNESLAFYHHAVHKQQRQVSKIRGRAKAENSTLSSSSATILCRTRPSSSSLPGPVDVSSKSHQLCQAQFVFDSENNPFSDHVFTTRYNIL